MEDVGNLPLVLRVWQVRNTVCEKFKGSSEEPGKFVIIGGV